MLNVWLLDEKSWKRTDMLRLVQFLYLPEGNGQGVRQGLYGMVTDGADFWPVPARLLELAEGQ